MKIIGNIIFNEELVNHTNVDFINYYYNTLENIDYDLPTLFVGWEFLRLNHDFPILASILEKRVITNKFYWEFSFDENKPQHVSGVDDFVKKVPNYYYSPKYNYTNLDPVMFNISNIIDLLNILPSNPDVVYNYKNEMLYILFDNKIIGLDLVMYSYFDFDIASIILTLQNNSIDVHVDSEGLLHQEQYKIFPNFDKLKRYMVALLSNS